MRKYTLIIIALFLFNHVFCQNRTIDSLSNAPDQEKQDTNKYKLCLQIAKIYADSAYDKSLIFFNKALSIADKSRDRKKLAHVYHQIGYMYQRKGEFFLALENYNNALTIHESINNEKGIGQLLNDIGLIYKTWGKYDKALENYINALRIFDEIGDVFNGAMASNNIGQIYFYRNEYEKAIDYFKKYLEVNQQAKYKRAVAGAANNIASAYMELNKLDDAFYYYNLSLSIYDSLDIKLGVAIIKDNLGSLFIRKNEYNRALNEHLDALKIFNAIESQPRICNTLQNIGIAFSKLKQSNKAIDYLSKSLDLAMKLHQKETEKSVYESLSEAYVDIGDYKKALACQIKYTQIKDSLLNAETISKLEVMQANYDTQKKEKELVELNQKLNRQRLILPLSFFVFSAFSILIFLVIKENNHKKRILSLSLKETNNLNTILSRIGNSLIKHTSRSENIANYFTDSWEISTNKEDVCLSVSYLKKENTLYFICYNYINSENCMIQKLSIFDFLFSNQHIKEKTINVIDYNTYIQNDSDWHSIVEKNFDRLSFIVIDSTFKKITASGNALGFLFHNNILIPFNDLSDWITIDSNDRIYIIVSKISEEDSELFLKEALLSIERSIAGSLNQDFKTQREILQSTCDFEKNRSTENIDIAIAAIKV